MDAVELAPVDLQSVSRSACKNNHIGAGAKCRVDEDLMLDDGGGARFVSDGISQLTMGSFQVNRSFSLFPNLLINRSYYSVSKHSLK